MAAPMQNGGVPEWSISDRLRKAREDKTGLTTEAFAEEISVSRSTVNNYESAKWDRSRKQIVLKAWALRCGVPLSWLITGEVSPDDGGEQRKRTSRWKGGNVVSLRAGADLATAAGF